MCMAWGLLDNLKVLKSFSQCVGKDYWWVLCFVLFSFVAVFIRASNESFHLHSGAKVNIVLILCLQNTYS